MSVDDLLAAAAGLIVIGGGANLQRLLLLREELLTLHIRLADKAAVRRHLKLRLDGLEDGLLLRRLLRLDELELRMHVLHDKSDLL